MKIALRNVRFIQSGHPLNGQLIEVGISQGKITSVGNAPTEADKVIEVEGLCISAGWLDMRASIGEPGHENREHFTTGTQAAARGGFTELALLPSNAAIPQVRSAIEYIVARTEKLSARIRPMAALTVEMAGNDLTEITDLDVAGAVAFSDGSRALNRADVMARALEYVQPMAGLIIQQPYNKDLSASGVMHEGVVSTRLGLRGIPSVAEELLVQRDIQLLAYTGGKLHFSLLSTRGSVEQVKQAKRSGLGVTCDIAAHQLAFTDDTLLPFDSNYKVNPPFRSKTDVAALVKGLSEGTIDAIVSDHQPLDPESKELEFDLAEFGITGLETAFAVANTCLNGKIPLELLIKKLTDGPRKVLGLELPQLEDGAEANFTLFDPEKEWVFREDETESMSKNSPFYGKTLRGKVYATIIGNAFNLNRFW